MSDWHYDDFPDSYYPVIAEVRSTPRPKQTAYVWRVLHYHTKKNLWMIGEEFMTSNDRVIRWAALDNLLRNLNKEDAMKEYEDLTAEEQQLVELFVKGLTPRVGPDNAITAIMMAGKMRQAGHQVETGSVVRIITHIMSRGLVPGLIPSPKGYYVATDKQDIQSFMDRLENSKKMIEAAHTHLQGLL